ncbi:MAG: hypothetical protein KDJ99_33030, partial [Candidatus Competibacteraceae bacterium]|nr:hypothetical protein [Candidatus Competibacteraceae bacterium]
MLSQSGERTFIPSIFPLGVGHVHTCISTVLKNPQRLLDLFAFALSLPVDFRVKSTGMGHANKNLLNNLPMPAERCLQRVQLHDRALATVALNRYYADLWQ